jgi:hypothetical protein
LLWNLQTNGEVSMVSANMLATLRRRSSNSNEVPSFSTFEQPRVAPLKIVAPKGSPIVTSGVLAPSRWHGF